ncbi:hypothetical protein [Actinophytocola sp.]|uniref:hypothetical protein n=1 Tax=Actinophytocola sp. TaxID=1872138 RepID=UPI002D80DDE5|nr:hypothetical protein [Actinophytocola sp.]HET9143798.1 hypothetical protein [Actinophytocola sp.]HEU5109057.1 hypothetical protein [Micromonosporaceae bacterium]
MAVEEIRAWIMLVVSVLGYLAYVVIVLAKAGDGPLVEVSYAWTLLWIVAAAIVVSIVLHILFGALATGADRRKDQRDREIGRLGDYIGQSFVIIGAVAAMLMAMVELAHFWIANVIYLAFVLSAVVGSVAKIFAYRKGFQSW